jgi:O-antigen ligase
MPPILALFFCTILTVWLLRKDIVARERMPPTLWIPLIWLLIFSSRPVVEWLHFGGGGSEIGGNSTDATIQFGLIAAAFIVLNRRGFRWSTLPFLNAAFFVLLLYFAVSIVWTPYPFVACKRLFKEFGQLLMIMVILTEADPIAAVKIVASRCAIVLFPLSVVLIKYYPAYGRNFSGGGFQMVTGVTTQKNSLGSICAIFGIVLVWDIVDAYRERIPRQWLKPMMPRLIVLAIGVWLLIWSDSKTSLLAFVIGVAIFFCTGSKLVRRSVPSFAKFIFLTVAAGLVVTSVWTFAVVPMLEAVGRDATFTERTSIWTSVLKQDINPLIGCGYYSFWLAKGPAVWEDWPGRFKPHSAHCGYLETYLDGGLIGCTLLGIFLVVTSWRITNLCSHADSLARTLFALAMMALIMNFSEVYFFRLDISWFFLVFAAMASHPLMFGRTVALEDEHEYPLDETVPDMAVSEAP